MARDFISRCRRLARPFADALHTWRCRRVWRRGGQAGSWIPVAAAPPSEGLPATWPGIVVHTSDPSFGAWRRRQTLEWLRSAEEHAPADGAPFAFIASGPQLPDLDAHGLQAALLVLAAEEVDAVQLLGQGSDEPTVTVYRGDAYRYNEVTGRVEPTGRRHPKQRLTKCLAPFAADAEAPAGRYARGPYRSDRALPGRLRVGVRDAQQILGSQPRRAPTGKPVLLVTAPFLARGGAEQTLFATLEHLQDRFDLVFATLAPHRRELGDRRADFAALSPHLFSLGDWVHPAAMPGMLRHLIDGYGVSVLYNANGTTLFYDFAPQLKAAFPQLRIVDHLYDHRVGYVERYDAELLEAVDACVAENHPIQDELERRGWPAERVPVVWPCGRPDGTFPEDPAAVGRRVRGELGIPDDTVVFFSAVRMHAQKRPLDFVRLAQRCADLENLLFLLVGGGDLEEDVDAAIAEAQEQDPNLPIRRLPFRQDIPDLLCAVDVGYLVSDFEGLPVFLLECLQAGRPFLGTDVGELGRVVRDTGAGLVVDTPGDLDALEAAVRQLMDDHLRQRLAQRAVRAAPCFSVAACAERYAGAFLGEPLPPQDAVLRNVAESNG